MQLNMSLYSLLVADMKHLSPESLVAELWERDLKIQESAYDFKTRDRFKPILLHAILKLYRII